MGSTIYRPGHAKAESLAITADWDEKLGWSLIVVRRSPSAHGYVSQRMVYRGLEDSELIDVVDVELSQALALI